MLSTFKRCSCAVIAQLPVITVFLFCITHIADLTITRVFNVIDAWVHNGFNPSENLTGIIHKVLDIVLLVINLLFGLVSMVLASPSTLLKFVVEFAKFALQSIIACVKHLCQFGTVVVTSTFKSVPKTVKAIVRPGFALFCILALVVAAHSANILHQESQQNLKDVRAAYVHQRNATLMNEKRHSGSNYKTHCVYEHAGYAKKAWEYIKGTKDSYSTSGECNYWYTLDHATSEEIQEQAVIESKGPALLNWLAHLEEKKYTSWYRFTTYVGVHTETFLTTLGRSVEWICKLGIVGYASVAWTSTTQMIGQLDWVVKLFSSMFGMGANTAKTL